METYKIIVKTPTEIRSATHIDLPNWIKIPDRDCAVQEDIKDILSLRCGRPITMVIYAAIRDLALSEKRFAEKVRILKQSILFKRLTEADLRSLLLSVYQDPVVDELLSEALGSSEVEAGPNAIQAVEQFQPGETIENSIATQYLARLMLALAEVSGVQIEAEKRKGLTLLAYSSVGNVVKYTTF